MNRQMLRESKMSKSLERTGMVFSCFLPSPRSHRQIPELAKEWAER